MKEYSIQNTRHAGRDYKQIRFMKNGKTLLLARWKPEDKEAEEKAIRSADITIIKHKLNYNTRKLKKKE
jgi:hypothetical protein